MTRSLRDWVPLSFIEKSRLVRSDLYFTFRSVSNQRDDTRVLKYTNEVCVWNIPQFVIPSSKAPLPSSSSRLHITLAARGQICVNVSLNKRRGPSQSWKCVFWIPTPPLISRLVVLLDSSIIRTWQHIYQMRKSIGKNLWKSRDLRPWKSVVQTHRQLSPKRLVKFNQLPLSWTTTTTSTWKNNNR